MFRLVSLDEDTHVQTNWTVGEEENELLGGIQVLSSELQASHIGPSSTQALFKQEGKRLYNATKTRALRLCSETNRCKWTQDIEKATDFSFVEQTKGQVLLMAERDRLVLHKNGTFQPFRGTGDTVLFSREYVPSPVTTRSSTTTSSENEITVTATEDDRWGNWIYVLLVFFLVLLIYFIYLLDKASCVFSKNYSPPVSEEAKGAVPCPI